MALAAVVLVRRRSGRLEARARRLRADALEPVSGRPPLASAPGRHLRTVAGVPPADVCLPELPPDLAGELVVTERELVVSAGARALHVPLARVEEASFVPAFERHRAGERSTLLSVRWQRGGEQLATVLEVFGQRLQAERLRREIHLRAGRVRAPGVTT